MVVALPEIPRIEPTENSITANLGIPGLVSEVRLEESVLLECTAALDSKFCRPLADRGIAVDSTEYFDAAEVLEGVLPDSLRIGLASLRQGAVDALIVRGLPVDEEPGPTPGQPSRRDSPPPRAHALTAAVVRRLGYELAYSAEKGGAVVQDVYPTREGATSQSNASWQVDLQLHTENAFHPVRPDFIVLYCVRAPQDPPPSTNLVLLDEVLPKLTDHEVALLREPRYTVRVVESFRINGEPDMAVPISVLGGTNRRPTVRWHESLTALDEAARRAALVFAEEAAKATLHVRLGPGDLLAFANDRCLHGRDKFDARCDGMDRWLLRAYAIRDSVAITRYIAPTRTRTVRLDIASTAGT